MLRYNIFNIIHKALRVKLYNTAQNLQQTSFADTDQAAYAFEKVNEIIEAFEHHGEREDTVVMPVIEKFNPAAIASFEKEHIDDRRMGNNLRHLQNIYDAAQSPQERMIAGSAVTKAFTDYMIFNLQHMQREEVELNDLLWNYYTDDEIQKINDQIMADTPPEVMAIIAQWIMQAINSDEAIELLTGLKEKAPEPVFASIFALTETALPERFRSTVQGTVLAHKTSDKAIQKRA